MLSPIWRFLLYFRIKHIQESFPETQINQKNADILKVFSKFECFLIFAKYFKDRHPFIIESIF